MKDTTKILMLNELMKLNRDEILEKAEEMDDIVTELFEKAEENKENSFLKFYWTAQAEDLRKFTNEIYEIIRNKK